VEGEPVGCEVIPARARRDPGAVGFDGIAAAQARGADVVVIDTAGRLHTQVNLMNELEKIGRVIKKRIPDAPHECLLTIDATTGQNGLIQARMFKQAVDLTGVVLTKMDGTAKGGIALAVSHELDLPISHRHR
jgi:fused signal recognition particle receptor